MLAKKSETFTLLKNFLLIVENANPALRAQHVEGIRCFGDLPVTMTIEYSCCGRNSPD